MEEYMKDEPVEEFMSWSMEHAKEKIKNPGPDQAFGYYRLATIYLADKDYHGAAAFL